MQNNSTSNISLQIKLTKELSIINEMICYESDQMKTMNMNLEHLFLVFAHPEPYLVLIRRASSLLP